MSLAKCEEVKVPQLFQVIQVLPYLCWNDLLRLRRVCKATYLLVLDYFRNHPELAPELEINEETRSWKAFLELGIPTTKLFLNNASGYGFYQKDRENIAKFLQEYGAMVKHLRLNQLSLNIYGLERDFLEALVNLKTITAQLLDGAGESKRQEGEESWREAQQQMFLSAHEDPRFKAQMFPNIFRQLESLDNGQDKIWAITNIAQRTICILEMNPVLEYLKMPFNPYIDLAAELPMDQDAQFEPFHVPLPALLWQLGQYISGHLGDPGVASKLKVFDFACFHDSVESVQEEVDLSGVPSFTDLCRICVKHQVKLMNVSATLLNCLNMEPTLGHPVLGLVNLQPWVQLYDMPNLEKIEIRQTSRSNVGTSWKLEEIGRPKWPRLKCLDINVDSRVDKCQYLDNPLPTTNLFQFLFQDVKRLALTELRINFFINAELVAVPKCDDIIAACPNLKKLTLVNWQGTNKSLLKVWAELKGLEEIELEYCENVGNVTFVGLDVNNPVFFKLKKLRKLTLKGLDKMQKIEDLTFSLVLRHLPLTHLTLTSDKPVTSVTKKGIMSLLDGPFAESIEKFSFKGWSLADVSDEEFLELEQKFRSYRML